MKIFDDLRNKIMNQKENNELYELYNSQQEIFDDVIKMINSVETSFKIMREHTLTSLLNGEWVETEDIEEYLGISFSQGMKLFDFSRTAEWNPPPLNGQCITTKFRFKVPKTNADMIRKMSDEQLADEMFKFSDVCEQIGFCHNDILCSETLDRGELIEPEMCKRCLMNWLKKEVKE